MCICKRLLNVKWATLAIALPISSTVFAGESGCVTAPAPVAACHTVHGRLNLTNGRWGAAIWVVGTRHIIGVMDDNDGVLLLPSNVNLDPHRAEVVYGDFTVCPLLQARPGHVEQVCVESANNLRIRSEH